MWTLIVAVLVVTSLPYLYGYLSSPPDRQFMGLMLDIPDHGQYLSASLKARRATPHARAATLTRPTSTPSIIW